MGKRKVCVSWEGLVTAAWCQLIRKVKYESPDDYIDARGVAKDAISLADALIEEMKEGASDEGEQKAA